MLQTMEIFEIPAGNINLEQDPSFPSCLILAAEASTILQGHDF